MALNERSKKLPTCPTHGCKLVRRQGRFGAFYSCPEYPQTCDVTANKSENGKFYMTDQETRDARKATHAAFDALWKNGPMRRGDAYRWLCLELKLDRNECHISMMDVEQCRKVQEAVAEFWKLAMA